MRKNHRRSGGAYINNDYPNGGIEFKTQNRKDRKHRKATKTNFPR